MNDFAADTDSIAEKLVAGGMDPQQAMTLALRLSQSRQQSLLSGVPVEPPVSDIPPVQEPILGGDTSKLFQRDPTLLERAKQLPADVLGAGEALASLGSAVALMPASMMYALRPGQQTQGSPLEFMQRNMYIPRTESGARHLQGLGEVLEGLPQTGPLPELQAFTGIGRGVGRQLQQKGKEAAQSLAPAAANVAEDFLSRQGLLLQAAPSSPKPAAPRSDIGFYSPAEEAAMSLQRQSGRGEGFLNDLKKAGVRDDELEFSGLKEFLAGKPNVTKQDIDDYIKNNKVQVNEVVLGGKQPFDAKRLADLESEYKSLKQHPVDDPSFGEEKFNELIRLMNIRDQSTTNSLYKKALQATRIAQRAQQRGDRVTAERYFREAEFLNTRAEKLDLRGEGMENPPKYDRYQLPGGENYREVLLTLPSSKAETTNDIAKRLFNKEMRFLSEDEKNQVVQESRRLFETQPKEFKSAHWDQPNVISHIRLNDRTDADGKKVLFVEEIQSDWGQEGKKKGFSNPKIKPISSKQFDAFTDSLFDEYINQAVSRGEDRQVAGRTALHMRFEDLAKTLGKEDEYQRMRSGRDLDMAGKDLIPSAPFVQNTKDWVNLSLKRIMNMAAEQGYDRIAFINGSQSADRYDLSKQVDRIVIPMVNADNTRSVRIDPVGGASIKLMVNPSGKVMGFGAGSNQFTGKRLDEVVGKELADKIMKSPAETELTGIDLKVGGEGMKSFYDKIVPDLAGKLVSKYGGKMSTVSFPGKPRDVGTGWSSVDEDVTGRPAMNQLGFDITPQMKEAVARGLPMFKQGGHVKAVESARRAIMKAMGGSVKMGRGGLMGTALTGAGKAAKAGRKSTKLAREAAAASRAPAKSKQEIEDIARRIAEQTQSGFVRASPESSINPAGKSLLQYELEQRTPMVVESTITDRPVNSIDYEQQLGKVIVGVPGDPTMGQVAAAGSLEAATRGGKQLVQVGDVNLETPVQLYGGPRYGANLDEVFWASNLSPARAVQNLVKEMAEKYGPEQVLGKYIKMSPESSRFAMHNLDALISVLQPEKLPKDKIELLNNLVRKGTPKHQFPQFPGFEDPINLLLQAQMDSKLRKHIAEVLEKPTVAKEVGFPFSGKVVQSAITEPELRNVETGITGYAIGKMNPKGKLTPSSHPTYQYDIPGQAIGKSKYLVPYEVSFPDFAAWYRSRPDVQAKVDPVNMMKSYGPRQVIDQQYIDEMKMYEEAMKRLTGKKKGGLAKMAGGGALSKAAAAAAKQASKRLPQVEGMVEKVGDLEKISILPVPNRWFLQPDKFPKVQSLIETILETTGKTREDFGSGAFVNSRTGEILDGRVMNEVGVVINPTTKRPMMSGLESGLETLDPKLGSFTKSNLVRQSLFKPTGGDPLLSELPFIATIEKGGPHFYGISTEYASPTELYNTMRGDNPTLRPRSRGDLFGVGDVIGRVKIGAGPEHDVYEKLFVAPKGSDVEGKLLKKRRGGKVGGLSALRK